MAARTAAAVTPLPDSQGSRRLDHFDEWLRKKGCRAAAWCQRTSSSAPGSSRNPPTSAASQEQGFGPRQHHGGVWTGSQPLEAKDVMLPPQKEIPARLRDSSMGMVTFRCSQLAVLSPVHTAPGPQQQKKTKNSQLHTKKNPQHRRLVDFWDVPNLCDPAKKERERTKGLSRPPERLNRPSMVALCCGWRIRGIRGTLFPAP